MSIATTHFPAKSWSSLRQLLLPQAQRVERCELCGALIPGEHDHVLELANRQLQCACRACALLFHDGKKLRFIRVPQRCNVLRDFRLSDKLWDSFLIPINLAFFFYHTGHNGIVAVYPSPAGATESLLELDAWNELVDANPVLNQIVPDVEALLMNRVGDARDYYRVSIDRCYELVGLIRLHWRGLSGGKQVWQAITEFFNKLQRA